VHDSCHDKQMHIPYHPMQRTHLSPCRGHQWWAPILAPIEVFPLPSGVDIQTDRQTITRARSVVMGR
jgi:hypothetical protein